MPARDIDGVAALAAQVGASAIEREGRLSGNDLPRLSTAAYISRPSERRRIPVISRTHSSAHVGT